MVVDVRGLSCPEPILIMMDAMSDNPGEELTVLCDEAHTRKNIERALQHEKKRFEVVDKGAEYEITFTA